MLENNNWITSLSKKKEGINYSTALGSLFSIILILFIVFYAANDPLIFLNLPGLTIVIIGTVSALFLSHPLKDIKQGAKSIKRIIFYESLDPQKEADEIIAVAKMWFHRDAIAVENVIDSIHNPYLKTSFQLIVDQTPIEDILSLLKWRITRLQVKEKAESNIFYSLANYAPAFGMLGTLVGLINMLQIIELKDISAITSNMAIALITTFYGLLFSNLIFMPIAVKLERRTEQRIMIMSIVLEGITLIADRRTPSFIRETLNAFIADHDNELENKKMQ